MFFRQAVPLILWTGLHCLLLVCEPSKEADASEALQGFPKKTPDLLIEKFPTQWCQKLEMISKYQLSNKMGIFLDTL